MPRKIIDNTLPQRKSVRPFRLGELSLGFGLGGLILAAAPASGQDPDLGRCLAIADVAVRIQCYDAVAKARQGVARGPGEAQAEQLPVTPAPLQAEAGQAAISAPPAVRPKAEFGLSDAQREKRLPSAEQQLDAMTTTVLSAELVGPGYWQFKIQDGAIWRMAESPGLFRPPQPGDSVQIRRGALGSYYLDADRQPGVRVKRVG